MIFNAIVGCASNSIRPNLKYLLCQTFFNSLKINNNISYYLVKNKFKQINQNEKLNLLVRKSSILNDVKDSCYIDFNNKFTQDEEESIVKNMIVIESFINEDEEIDLFKEIEPYMKRLRYEFSHWDNAIHGYRETERLKWNEENTKIINRVRKFAFLPGSPTLSHVHILDLAEDGYIKPHIDAVRFCGNTIAGLSLLTDSVMRLVHDKNKTKIVDVLLKRRSLYVMRVKELWVNAARRKKGINSSDIASSLPASTIYINEQLTPHNKALLGRARRLQRDGKLYFAGYYNGKVLVKPTDKDAATRVFELEDMDKYE